MKYLNARIQSNGLSICLLKIKLISDIWSYKPFGRWLKFPICGIDKLQRDLKQIQFSISAENSQLWMQFLHVAIPLLLRLVAIHAPFRLNKIAL